MTDALTMLNLFSSSAPVSSAASRAVLLTFRPYPRMADMRGEAGCAADLMADVVACCIWLWIAECTILHSSVDPRFSYMCRAE